MDSERKKIAREKNRKGKEGREGKKICNAMTCQFLLVQ
jgi:hypothetical protein